MISFNVIWINRIRKKRKKNWIIKPSLSLSRHIFPLQLAFDQRWNTYFHISIIMRISSLRLHFISIQTHKIFSYLHFSRGLVLQLLKRLEWMFNILISLVNTNNAIEINLSSNHRSIIRFNNLRESHFFRFLKPMRQITLS